MLWRTKNSARLDRVAMSGSSKKRDTSFGIYPSYLFKDHDPILDQIDTLFDLAKANGFNVSFVAVSAESKVSAGTLTNWRTRKTKKPQVATVAAVANYLGGELTLTYRGRTVFRSQKHNG